MSKVLTALAVTAVFGMTVTAAIAAPSDGDLAQIRDQIRQMKDEYEARMRALEQRLQDAEARGSASVAVTSTGAGTAASTSAAVSTGASVSTGAAASQTASAPSGLTANTVPASVPASTATGPNAFNPAMSLILGGSYARLSQDPSQYRIQGFVPGGESGPGTRNFNLGESELTLSASIDHRFFGQLTFSLGSNNEASVEEGFFRTQGLASGVNVTAGRFLSGIGYLNSQHAHAWDFVDLPLAYQAFLGGQYRNDGLRATWLAPLDQFVELGIEAGRGGGFPGNERSTNGLNAAAAFARIGDDWGESTSWRAGVSYLRTHAADRRYDDIDRDGNAVVNAFTGKSAIWIADGIFKWSPNGNATQTNLKLQGEYFRRGERGTLDYDSTSLTTSPTTPIARAALSARYDSTQSGFYVQGVYQFMPQWRAGLRFDKLYAGTLRYGLLDDASLSGADLSRLLSYNPSRATAMLDWSPSEFSRLRVQVARDQSRPGVTDNQLFIQYIMSMGAHGAHAF